MPEKLTTLDHSTTSFSSSAKGKGKEVQRDDIKKEDGDDDDDDGGGGKSSLANGVAMTATQGGDRADAIAKTQAGERFLKAVRDTWDDHCACMGKLRDVLKYVVGRNVRLEDETFFQ